MLKRMNELEEVWQRMITDARFKAETSGNSDIAEYLALRAFNDELRSAGCRWLFDSFLQISDELNRQGIRLTVENENPHRFAVGRATMVGSLLRFVSGVRNLTVETGWTRTPTDGFMRGNALACARISHFGMTESNAELALTQTSGNAPQWFSSEKDGTRIVFDLKSLRRHFEIFADHL